MAGGNLKGDDTCRLKAGVRHIKGRWYVSVAIWDNEHCHGRPIDERVGPAKGLATKAEALIYSTLLCTACPISDRRFPTRAAAIPRFSAVAVTSSSFWVPRGIGPTGTVTAESPW